jgi:hypothetical protein
MPDLLRELGDIDGHSEVRSLRIKTPRTGPLSVPEVLEHHVQGVARTRVGGRDVLIISLSGEHRGELWMCEFALEADPTQPGRSPRLASEGKVRRTFPTALPHPGGIQAHQNLLAVASEADTGSARVDIYDLAGVSARPQYTLLLDGSLLEGPSQAEHSKAGWVAFSALGPDEYLLFVGGRHFATQEGWFYRFRPAAQKPWSFAGMCHGTDDPRLHAHWGPQNGAALLKLGEQDDLQLLTFGSKGSDGRDGMRPRLRCFALTQAPGQPCTLTPEATDQPGAYALPHADFSRLFGPNPRWGSGAFVDQDGALLTYFTARNARPDHEGVHTLELLEVRARR